MSISICAPRREWQQQEQQRQAQNAASEARDFRDFAQYIMQLGSPAARRRVSDPGTSWTLSPNTLRHSLSSQAIFTTQQVGDRQPWPTPPPPYHRASTGSILSRDTSFPGGLLCNTRQVVAAKGKTSGDATARDDTPELTRPLLLAGETEPSAVGLSAWSPASIGRYGASSVGHHVIATANTDHVVTSTLNDDHVTANVPIANSGAPAVSTGHIRMTNTSGPDSSRDFVATANPDDVVASSAHHHHTNSASTVGDVMAFPSTGYVIASTIHHTSTTASDSHVTVARTRAIPANSANMTANRENEPGNEDYVIASSAAHGSTNTMTRDVTSSASTGADVDAISTHVTWDGTTPFSDPRVARLISDESAWNTVQFPPIGQGQLSYGTESLSSIGPATQHGATSFPPIGPPLSLGMAPPTFPHHAINQSEIADLIGISRYYSDQQSHVTPWTSGSSMPPGGTIPDGPLVSFLQETSLPTNQSYSAPPHQRRPQTTLDALPETFLSPTPSDISSLLAEEWGTADATQGVDLTLPSQEYEIPGLLSSLLHGSTNQIAGNVRMTSETTNEAGASRTSSTGDRQPPSRTGATSSGPDSNMDCP